MEKKIVSNNIQPVIDESSAKKENFKKWIWIGIGFVVIVILILLFFGIRKYQETSYIGEGNNVFYNALVCWSDCPSEITAQNMSTINRDCMGNCNNEFDTPTKYQNLEEDTLFRDVFSRQGSNNCMDSFITSLDNGGAFQECLKRVLPVVKEKYNINN
tara:strand:- start:20 stop:493 length:474 start_codon:yes stop_codon:yes gene_type:complete